MGGPGSGRRKGGGKGKISISNPSKKQLGSVMAKSSLSYHKAMAKKTNMGSAFTSYHAKAVKKAQGQAHYLKKIGK